MNFVQANSEESGQNPLLAKIPRAGNTIGGSSASTHVSLHAPVHAGSLTPPNTGAAPPPGAAPSASSVPQSDSTVAPHAVTVAIAPPITLFPPHNAAPSFFNISGDATISDQFDPFLSMDETTHPQKRPPPSPSPASERREKKDRKHKRPSRGGRNRRRDDLSSPSTPSSFPSRCRAPPGVMSQLKHMQQELHNSLTVGITKGFAACSQQIQTLNTSIADVHSTVQAQGRDIQELQQEFASMRVELDGIKSSPPTLPSPAAAAVHTSGSSEQQENVWSHTDVFCRGWPEATRNTLIQIYLQQIVDQYPELGGEVKETQMTHPDFLFLSFPNSDLRGQFLKKIRDNRPPPFCFLGKSYVIRITAAQPPKS